MTCDVNEKVRKAPAEEGKKHGGGERGTKTIQNPDGRHKNPIRCDTPPRTLKNNRHLLL